MNLTEVIRAVIDRNICTRQSSDQNKRFLTEALVKAIPKREHGNWISQSWGYECSKCHEFIEGGWDNEANSMKPFANFCPHCGADMRGEKK